MDKVLEFLPYIIGGYEVITRIIPTSKDWTILTKVIGALSFFNKILNNKKKGTSTFIFLLFVFAFSSCSTIKQLDCRSTKYVDITFVDKEGRTYTANVPYCDTVSVKQIPDSVGTKVVRQ